jgi:antitoxin component HigA of HigAB toxin-antitoxin module
MRDTKNKLPPSYFALVKEYPLVPIKTERQYDAAVAFLQKLAIRDENTLDRGEQAYLETLTHFVGDYEDKHFRDKMAP